MDGWVMIKTELDTKLIDKQIKELESELVDLEKQYEEVSTNKMFEWQEEEARKLRKEINRVNEEIDTLEGQRLKVDMFGNMKNSIDGIGDGITKIVKKVARWGVAIFGVRSAYMAVRSAMGTISENDEQLKADIDYIKDALAYTLEPVVRRIVDLIKQLMFYVAYLTKAWTGKNIFENANKSLKGANKQAKDLKKSMAGFDEMNVLQDTSSGGGGGGADVNVPTMDLSEMKDMELPKWFDELASAILVTTSEKLAREVSEQVEIFVEELSRTEIMRKSLDNYGYILVADTMEDVIDIANEIASEHLEILTVNPLFISLSSVMDLWLNILIICGRITRILFTGQMTLCSRLLA